MPELIEWVVFTQWGLCSDLDRSSSNLGTRLRPKLYSRAQTTALAGERFYPTLVGCLRGRFHYAGNISMTARHAESAAWHTGCDVRGTIYSPCMSESSVSEVAGVPEAVLDELAAALTEKSMYCSTG